jgi:hypothetical protein
MAWPFSRNDEKPSYTCSLPSEEEDGELQEEEDEGEEYDPFGCMQTDDGCVDVVEHTRWGMRLV